VWVLLSNKVNKVNKVEKYKFGENSIFLKAIAITKDDLLWIDKIRGRKSKAGKLKEIIDFYRLKNKL
jgi:hypothetical protein